MAALAVCVAYVFLPRHCALPGSQSIDIPAAIFQLQLNITITCMCVCVRVYTQMLRENAQKNWLACILNCLLQPVLALLQQVSAAASSRPQSSLHAHIRHSLRRA